MPDARILTAAAEQRAGRLPEVAARQSEEKDLVRSTLSNLSERQREAVILRFFEQLTVEDTAAAMGCAPGTVKATVHQALRILRNRLKQLT